MWVSAGSVVTVSGAFVILATLLIANRRFFESSLLMTVAGSGGLAMFWDRWSLRAGDQAHFGALLSAPAPSPSELRLLITHAPLLALGIFLLLRERSRWQRRGR